MEAERKIDKLAGWIMKLFVASVIIALCWYFRSVLVYILGAFVVSLIGRPIRKGLMRITIKGKSAPTWLLSILTIIIIFSLMSLTITEIIPIVASLFRQTISFDNLIVGNPLDHLNEWLLSVFPSLGEGFDLSAVIIESLRNAVDISKLSSNISGFLGSLTSGVIDFGIGIFSIVFISFFFIKDESLFPKIIAALVPDEIELKVKKTISDIEYLLSRYFVGLFAEVLGVAIVDFLGLWLIAQIGIGPAAGLAFIAGLLNLIPYVGPFIGTVTGIVIGVLLKLGTGVGLDVNIWVFAIILLGILQGTQFIDNFIYQPLIYSTSIKANALEIFIVLLIAGHLGGPLALLVAIPIYTVVRVIASRFMYDYKPIKKLVPDLSEEDKIINSPNYQ